MAARRMFSLTVVETDDFMTMSVGAQALYFHLGLRADDDGFVSSPKMILRATGIPEDDMKLLILKGFIIPFSSGVIVITHWRQQNTLRKDRYNETVYKEEKRQLNSDVNGKYLLERQKDSA
jgi:hypothetical protein